MGKEFTFKPVTDFTSTKEIDSYLDWWAQKTTEEPRMLMRTSEFFRSNLLYAVFAFFDDQLIGAAGLIPCLNRNKERMYYNNSLVVEFGSNFVDMPFRDKRIGREFVVHRLAFARSNGYFPVSVTGHCVIQNIFQEIGGREMEKFSEYEAIRTEVRVCECEAKDCKICPLRGKAIWVFP